MPTVEEFSPTLPLREVYRQTIPQSQKITASPMKPRKGQNGAITFPKLSLCKIAALLKRSTDSSRIRAEYLVLLSQLQTVYKFDKIF